MSKKAFLNLRNHIEVEVLKGMTYEKINDFINTINNENKTLRSELKAAQKNEEMPETIDNTGSPKLPPSCKACPFNKMCRVLSHGCDSCAVAWRKLWAGA